ncbi:MAG: CsbD family protein [Bdellovibrionaceae bacterium]|nr:CsbD family protein [Pseudobdellovibrionaceae bacterium]
MNQDIMQGKWKEIKGEIRKVWGNITGDELEQTKGDLTSISGIIQQKYGQKKEEVSGKLDSIMGRFQADYQDKKEDFKQAAAKKTEQFKDELKNKDI